MTDKPKCPFCNAELRTNILEQPVMQVLQQQQPLRLLIKKAKKNTQQVCFFSQKKTTHIVKTSYLTRFNLGFARFALALAFLVELASIAPACFIEMPCFLAIERCPLANNNQRLCRLTFYTPTATFALLPRGAYRDLCCRTSFANNRVIIRRNTRSIT